MLRADSRRARKVPDLAPNCRTPGNRVSTREFSQSADALPDAAVRLTAPRPAVRGEPIPNCRENR